MSDNDSISEPKKEIRVIVRSYPKTIYLWPSMVAGFIIFLIDLVLRLTDKLPSDVVPATAKFSPLQEYQAYLASIWLAIFLFNLIIISFDFSLGKTFTIFVTVIVVVLIYVVLKDALFPGGLGLPKFKDTLAGLQISASPNFYVIISLMIFLILLATWIEARFNFWEFESNRIIHHRGIFEREESFSAQNSRVITSTDDIFERLLFRAGTIHILDPEKKLHIIENVYNANNKDKQIQELLSVVRVRSDA